ncbi:MAG: hypothetical protein M1813_009625 [Trichoglossum hirsutum]|nr:MAG: hypothetical protein M1813_009625 [Trichoglossum hirsutum]
MPDSDSDSTLRREEVANGEELRPDQEELKEVVQWYFKTKKASYKFLLSLKEGLLEHVDHLPEANPKAILNTLKQLYAQRCSSVLQV